MTGLQYLESQLADYQLIDCGGGEKLERFGAHVIRRPEPQAIWQPSLPEDEWTRLADATFRRDKHSDERGSWERRAGMPEQWTMEYALGSGEASGGAPGGASGGAPGAQKLRLRLALTGFKHVGVFPEQAENWRYIYDKVRKKIASRSERPSGKAREDFASERTSACVSEQNRSSNEASGALSPRVLNLFAYTGGATLAARAAGAAVTHVDSVKQTVSWARDNLILSELEGGGEGGGVRWMVDDALKFVRREVRRGNRYDGIILDPPAYGRGPEGEKWVLEQGLDEMLALCAQLLDSQGFMVLNLYSMGVSALVARTAVRSHFGGAGSAGVAGFGDGAGFGVSGEQFGELFVTDRSGKNLPLGVYYRFSRG